MDKFAIYTKWYWPKGIPTKENAERNMKEFSDKTHADDVLWWKADDNHHQSVIIFPSEEIATKELEMRKSHRKKVQKNMRLKWLRSLLDQF